MNRDRARELLPIIEAFANGEDIEFKHRFIDGWEDLPKDEGLCITFPAPDYEYRIKPQPETYWINIEEGWKTGDKTYVTKGVHQVVGGEWIKVREVLNDES